MASAFQAARMSVKKHFNGMKKEKKNINTVRLMMNDDVVVLYETQSSINAIK
jgi:hypothetical protein